MWNGRQKNIPGFIHRIIYITLLYIFVQLHYILAFVRLMSDEPVGSSVSFCDKISDDIWCMQYATAATCNAVRIHTNDLIYALFFDYACMLKL